MSIGDGIAMAGIMLGIAHVGAWFMRLMNERYMLVMQRHDRARDRAALRRPDESGNGAEVPRHDADEARWQLSEPRVRWDVKFLPAGFDDRPENYQRALQPCSRSVALRYASEFGDGAHARIVKLTRKAKPKVVAKLTFAASFSEYSNEPTLVPDKADRERIRLWVNERLGKKLVCIYRELSDE